MSDGGKFWIKFKDYSSLKDASEITGVAKSTISTGINSNQPAFGCLWQFITDELCDIIPCTKKVRRINREIYKLDADKNIVEKYSNMQDAILKTGLRGPSIANAISCKQKLYGFYYKYYDA